MKAVGKNLKTDKSEKGERIMSLDSESNIRRLNTSFVDSFLEVVIFGEVVLHFLELTSHFSRDEIVEKPEEFESLLEILLGDSEKIIVDKVINNLYEKLGIEYSKVKEYKLADYLAKAMNEQRS